MPKYRVSFAVTTVYAGDVEVEADNETAAKIIAENMGPDALEKQNGQLEAYYAEITNCKKEE